MMIFSRRAQHVAWLILLSAPVALAAQQLPLKRDLPSASWAGCPSAERPGEVAAAQRQTADRLAADATQASLLGDKIAALDLLTRAAAADPTSVTISYRLARALDELERPADALAAYCRYLTLAPPDSPDAQDVRERTRVLGTPQGFAVPAPAVRAYEEGIAHFDAGRHAEAEAAFGQASAAAPDWGAPLYNRALTRLARAQSESAAEDFRRFLALSPGAPEFSAVLDFMTTLRQTAPRYNPGGALFRGLLIPGLGQFTTDRTGAGVFYLATATSALAAGFLLKKLDVDCLSVPVDGQCPPSQVAGQRETRPYLVPAVAVALATGVYGAIDAYRSAGRRNRAAASPARDGQDGRARGPSLSPPGINLGPRGSQLELIRVRF